MASPYEQKLAKIRSRIDKKRTPGMRTKLKGLKAKEKAWQFKNSPQGQVAENPPLPWSAQYETGVATANRNLDFSNLDFNQQEQMVKQAYGFDDKSNPYSRAAQLQRQYQQNRNQTLNSYAAQGQLYAGSLSNARNLDKYSYDKAYDTEERNYQAALADIASGRLKAQRERDEGIAGLEAQRVEDALSQAPDPSEAPKGGVGPQAPSKSRKKLKKALARAQARGNKKRVRHIKKQLKGK